MEQKRIILLKSIMLVALFLAWMILPHFLGLRPLYLVLLGSVGLSFLFLVKRPERSAVIEFSSKAIKRFKMLDVLSFVFSVPCLLVILFVSMATIGMGNAGYAVCFWCVIIASLIGTCCAVIWLVSSWGGDPKIYHGNVLLGINAIALGIVYVYAFELYNHVRGPAMKDVLFVIGITVLVGLFCHAHYKPERDSKIGTFCAFAAVMAFMLFQTANVQFDASVADRHKYTVTSIREYKDTAECTMDDGFVFCDIYYSGKVGDYGYAYRYDGWFGREYYTRQRR